MKSTSIINFYSSILNELLEEGVITQNELSLALNFLMNMEAQNSTTMAA